MQIQQEYELVELDGDVDVLKEHPSNPNKGDVDVIGESIDINGWHGAIVAQRSTGYILAGNHRYRVAVSRGATHIPVLWRDVDDQTALRILLVDNESARRAEMDQELLGELLGSLESLDGTGYGLAGLEEEQEGGGADEEASGGEDEVPDDQYTGLFGCMVMCEGEEDQEAVYKRLQATFGEEREIRVVAV